MSTREILKDTTSFIGKVFLRDSTTGNGKTGVAAASMSGDYSKDDNSADVALSFSTGAVGDAYSSGKWAEIGNGWYFFHFPDACWTAFGETGFSFRASGAIDATPRYPVVAFDPEDTAWVNLLASAAGIIPGTAQTGTLSTTSMTTDLTGYADDELIGGLVVFTSGTAVGQRSTITDYASTNGQITYDAIATAPANNDTFVVV